MLVPSNAQWSGASLVQSANPTPYDVAPINSCSAWNPPPARRITRFGRPSVLGSSSTTPEIELPDRNARLTPASRAFVTFSNIRSVQYSSWPTDRNTFPRSSPLPSACVSTLEMYVTSYPSFSSQNASGNSVIRNSPDPLVSG